MVQQADPSGSRRPVVEMRVQLGEIQDTFEFTLADRSHLENEIILGRNFLADVTLVDVGQQFIQPRVLTAASSVSPVPPRNQGPFLFSFCFSCLPASALPGFRHQHLSACPCCPASSRLVWQVEARIEYTALGGASQVFLTLPPEQSGFRLLEGTGAAPGFGFSVEQLAEQRQATLDQAQRRRAADPVLQPAHRRRSGASG